MALIVRKCFPLVISFLVFGIAFSSPVSQSPRERDLQSLLGKIAAAGSEKYNCSVAIAFKNGSMAVAVASGTSNFDTGRPADPMDKFAWGSGTKPLTGSSILKLVSEGKFGLDDAIGPLVNPYIAQLANQSNGKQNWTNIDQLYGSNASKVTIRQLLAMESGIPDFDTAKPYPLPPTDLLRAQLYANPSHSMSPLELMAVPWITHGHLVEPDYSSTNFVILGLILARFTNAESWQYLNQTSFISKAGFDEFGSLKFAINLNDTLSDFSMMHGYDRTHYNNQTVQRDVYNVAGIFAGYTASDIVMDVTDAAQLAWEVYGKTPTIAPYDYAQLMIPTSSFYGLATFNLSRNTGFPKGFGTAYGHLGATYGFQSVLSYHPELDISLAIATNIETDDQVQPADVMCQTYNQVASLFTGTSYNCSFKSNGYFGGNCNCTTV